MAKRTAPKAEQLQDIPAQLHKVASHCGYRLYRPSPEDPIQFVTDSTPIRILCIHSPEEKAIYCWFDVRTLSADFSGDRTDLHEVIAFSFSAFLRVTLTISSRVWVVPNGFGPPGEVSAVMLAPEQPNPPRIYLDKAGQRALTVLLHSAIKYWELVWPVFHGPECAQVPEVDQWRAATPWAENIGAKIGETDPNQLQYMGRFCPRWMHYRSIKKLVTVVHSPALIARLREIHKSVGRWRVVPEPEGTFVVSEGTRNYVSATAHRTAAQLLKRVEPGSHTQPFTLLIENRLFIAGKEHLLVLGRECGRQRFDAARQKLRSRYEQESQVLFPPTSFEWRSRIDDNQFELLVRELLHRVKGISWIRRASAGRERDAGRDLIAEFMLGPLDLVQTTDKPRLFQRKRVVVQCKAFAATVGKSRVRDIRDTVEYHRAEGYFLVVSSQLSSGLIDHLCRMREEGTFYVDWWTRAELEDELAKHPDILERYHSVVTSR